MLKNLFYCGSNFKCLAPKRTQLYLAHETCIYETKIVRFDWSALFSAGFVLTVSHVCCGSFLYKKLA